MDLVGMRAREVPGVMDSVSLRAGNPVHRGTRVE